MVNKDRELNSLARISFATTAGSLGGLVAGVTASSLAGGLVGTAVVPVVGTVVGGAGGALVGWLTSNNTKASKRYRYKAQKAHKARYKVASRKK